MKNEKTIIDTFLERTSFEERPELESFFNKLAKHELNCIIGYNDFGGISGSGRVIK
jgi:hypothetical protein